MADPWYEVVRPIWREVVEITKSLDEDMWQKLLMSGIVAPETLPEFDILNSTAGEYFLEAYLVAASQGGERSFTAFLEFLKYSFLPGSPALARELQRMWTRVEKKGRHRRSEQSLRKSHLYLKRIRSTKWFSLPIQERRVSFPPFAIEQSPIL